MIRRVLTAFATLALTFAAVDVSAQPVRAYRVQAIGGNFPMGMAINKDGDITGCDDVSGGATFHAFRSTVSGGYEDLGTNGSSGACAFSINDAGDVVGLYADPSGLVEHPFIARKGTAMQNLHLTYPGILDLRAISNDGSLVGATNQFTPFRTFPDGTFHELSSTSGGGMAINGAGDIAGYAYFGINPHYTAFRYTEATGLVGLGTLSGEYSMATAINAGGTVVGYYGGEGPWRAFRARPGFGMEDLGVVTGSQPGLGATAYAINTAGEIVGASAVPGTSLAFIHTDAEGMVDLNGLIPLANRAAFSLYQAVGINDAGQIVAGSYDGSEYGTVRLVPVQNFDPPMIQPVATPSLLRSANNRMVPVTIDPRAKDEFDPSPSCQITHVTNSDMPFLHNDPDVRITSPLTVELRASVRGGFAGRVYVVAIACSNVAGKTSTAYRTVAVWR
jgi:probable HAF family extracellular repeat protein